MIIASLDSELQAMRSCHDVLDALPPESQQRVLEWLRAKIVSENISKKRGDGT